MHDSAAVPARRGYERVTQRPDQMGGVPCIRGMRIPVSSIVAMFADGMSEAEILADYPDLEVEDLREALRFAADLIQTTGPQPLVGK